MKLAPVLTFPTTRRHVARLWLPVGKRAAACAVVFGLQSFHVYLRGVADDVGPDRFALAVQRVESAAFGGTTPTEHLQAWFFNGHLRPHDYFCAGVHTVWFLIPWCILLWITVFKWQAFWSFAAAWLGILFVSDIGFFILPTQPPWMALPVHRVLATNGVISGFDPNPLAAMPSLHVALPVALALWSWLNRMHIWALLIGVWALTTATAAVYTGEHYVADVVGGVVAAFVVVQAERLTMPVVRRLGRRLTVGDT